MVPHDLAISRANIALVVQIRLLVGNKPCQAGDILNPASRRFHDSNDIAKRLRHLANEIVGFENLIRSPADLTADAQNAPLTDHAIRVALRRRPSLRLHGNHRHLIHLLRHGNSPTGRT